MMKKLICLTLILVLSCSMVMPVFAAQDDGFVPSITYKDGPETNKVVINKGDGGKKGADDCVIVTTVEQAAEKETDISQEDRDTLQDLYNQMRSGSVFPPVDRNNYVVWELFDLSFEYEDCREDPEHERKDEQLKEKGTTLNVTFDLGIGRYENIIVMVYIDGEWITVESVNNGDGTLTCLFEDLCPVVFLREKGYDKPVPTTGDTADQSLILWGAALAVSAAAIVGLVIYRRKFVR